MSCLMRISFEARCRNFCCTNLPCMLTFYRLKASNILGMQRDRDHGVFLNGGVAASKRHRRLTISVDVSHTKKRATLPLNFYWQHLYTPPWLASTNLTILRSSTGHWRKTLHQHLVGCHLDVSHRKTEVIGSRPGTKRSGLQYVSLSCRIWGVLVFVMFAVKNAVSVVRNAARITIMLEVEIIFTYTKSSLHLHPPNPQKTTT